MRNNTPETVTSATTNHQLWLGNGFAETVPVIPPNAPLHEHSRVDPKARGKCPGEFYGGAWDGLGGWTHYQMDPVKAVRWDQLGANVGLKMGDTWCALDVDVHDDTLAQAMLNRVHELSGGHWFIRWGQVPKFLVLFRVAEGAVIRRRQYPIRKDGVTMRVEILGVTANNRPSQAVVAGMHPSGSEYVWNKQPVADQIGTATADQMDWLAEEMINIAVQRGWEKRKATNINKTNDGLSSVGAQPFDSTLVGPVMDLIPNNDMEYDTWISLAIALKNSLAGEGWELFEQFSAKAPKNEPGFTKRTWDTLDHEYSSGFGKLVYHARLGCGGELPGELEQRVKDGYRLKQALTAGAPVIAPAPPVDGQIMPPGVVVQTTIPTPYVSQDELAVELGAHGWNEKARYLPEMGRFMFWTGQLWDVDQRLQSMTLVRDFLRWKADLLEQQMFDAMNRAETESKQMQIVDRYRKMQKEIKSSANVASVHSMMQTNQGMAVSVDELNTDPMKLGTPQGTVDLHTGHLVMPDPADLITKATAIAPAEPGTPAPIWQQFLLTVQNGDWDMINYLQRCAGYALTGLTTEHKFAFLYGTGRNGKGVFLNTLLGVMGAYGRKAPASVFLESRNTDHPTQLAGLQGMRLVFGSEIGEGQFWNESTLKDMTGGDKLTARYMRQDFFDFDPEFFLMIAGNNKPALRDTGQAIRDRMMLVPFTTYIPPEQRDPHLSAKLREEWPAILRWMIDGCLAWQNVGLAPPASVVAASQEYIDGEDMLGQFIAERCELGLERKAVKKEFTKAYNAWRASEGLQPQSNVKITKELETRAVYQKRTRPENSTRDEHAVECFVGVALVVTAPQLPPLV